MLWVEVGVEEEYPFIAKTMFMIPFLFMTRILLLMVGRLKGFSLECLWSFFVYISSGWSDLLVNVVKQYLFEIINFVMFMQILFMF